MSSCLKSDHRISGRILVEPSNNPLAVRVAWNPQIAPQRPGEIRGLPWAPRVTLKKQEKHELHVKNFQHDKF